MAAIFGHNLNRELQMATNDRDRETNEKRTSLWTFHGSGITMLPCQALIKETDAIGAGVSDVSRIQLIKQGWMEEVLI
jgi:hypothetical protein